MDSYSSPSRYAANKSEQLRRPAVAPPPQLSETHFLAPLSLSLEEIPVSSPTGSMGPPSANSSPGSPSLLMGPGPPIITGETERGPPGCNLFVFHLPNELTNWDLYLLFRKFGTILSVHTMVNKNTGLSRGFGFVSFAKEHEAIAAVKAMDGFRLGKKRLKVQRKREHGEMEDGEYMMDMYQQAGGVFGDPRGGVAFGAPEEYGLLNTGAGGRATGGGQPEKSMYLQTSSGGPSGAGFRSDSSAQTGQYFRHSSSSSEGGRIDHHPSMSATTSPESQFTPRTPSYSSSYGGSSSLQSTPNQAGIHSPSSYMQSSWSGGSAPGIDHDFHQHKSGHGGGFSGELRDDGGLHRSPYESSADPSNRLGGRGSGESFSPNGSDYPVELYPFPHMTPKSDYHRGANSFSVGGGDDSSVSLTALESEFSRFDLSSVKSSDEAVNNKSSSRLTSGSTGPAHPNIGGGGVGSGLMAGSPPPYNASTSSHHFGSPLNSQQWGGQQMGGGSGGGSDTGMRGQFGRSPPTTDPTMTDPAGGGRLSQSLISSSGYNHQRRQQHSPIPLTAGGPHSPRGADPDSLQRGNSSSASASSAYDYSSSSQQQQAQVQQQQQGQYQQGNRGSSGAAAAGGVAGTSGGAFSLGDYSLVGAPSVSDEQSFLFLQETPPPPPDAAADHLHRRSPPPRLLQQQEHVSFSMCGHVESSSSTTSSAQHPPPLLRGDSCGSTTGSSGSSSSGGVDRSLSPRPCISDLEQKQRR